MHRRTRIITFGKPLHSFYIMFLLFYSFFSRFSFRKITTLVLTRCPEIYDMYCSRLKWKLWAYSNLTIICFDVVFKWRQFVTRQPSTYLFAHVSLSDYFVSLMLSPHIVIITNRTCGQITNSLFLKFLVCLNLLFSQLCSCHTHM